MNLDAFFAPSSAPIGVVQEGMVWLGKEATPKTVSIGGLKLRDWSVGVLDFELNPTMDEAVLSSIVSSPNVKGLVLHAYPSGSIPEDLKGLSDVAGELGKPICFVSATGHEDLEHSEYAATHMYGDSAFIYADPMSRGGVVTKLSGSIGTVDRSMPQLTGVRRISEIARIFATPIGREFLGQRSDNLVSRLPELRSE